MHYTTRMSHIVEIDEDMYDLFDDSTLAKSSSNIFVQLCFRRKIQRYRGSGGGCLNSLAPIIPESYEKSISLDDACSNYPSHGKKPLYPLLLIAEIPENNVFDLLTLVNYRAKCYLKQQQQEEDRFYGGHGYDDYVRLPPMMVPIRIDIEVCTREYYGKLENIAGDISASTMTALETVSTVSIRLDSDNHGSEYIICLEKISAADNNRQISRIPFSHLYHTDCILRWLTKNFTCLTCRFQLPFEECLY